MQIRAYSKDDYSIVKDWWERNGIDPIPENGLSPVGGIAYEGELDIGAIWLYLSLDCGFCFAWLFITNPDSSPRQKFNANDLIIGYLKDRARDNNYGVMMEVYDQRSLVRAAERRGAIVNHANATQLLTVLQPKEVAA